MGPLMLNDLLTVMSQRADHVRVVSQLRKAGHMPLVKAYLLSTQPQNIKEVNDALFELYVQEEDHEALAAGVVEYTNFDAVEMAQMCEKHTLLQFRRIGAMLYRISKKWTQSVALSKKDKVWEEAISTTAESGEKLSACFSATLYTCYPLLRPDVVLELSWRNGLTDFAMPFMIQTMREMSGKLDGLLDKERKREEAVIAEKKKQEEALASGYNGMDYGAGDPNSMVVYGAGMGGGMGMQPGYGMQYGYQ